LEEEVMGAFFFLLTLGIAGQEVNGRKRYRGWENERNRF
jgi:hypothetical protein